MKFTYGLKELFESYGFDTTHWRVSNDGTHVLCHDQYARTLISNLDTHPNFQTYDYKSEEFKQLLQEQFTPKQEPEEEPQPE